MSTKTLSLATLATATLLVSGWALAADPVAPVAPVAQPAPMAAPAGKAAKAAKMDTNGDGSISREEAQAHGKLASRFDSLDTDKNGSLSSAEMKAHKEQHVGKPGKMDKADKPGKHVAGLDTNGDQLISREEAAKNPKMARHFDQADTNKDGQLSTDEIAAARQSRGK